MTKIHPNAIIEVGAKIDNSVEISAGAYISSRAVLRKGVKIMQGAGVYGETFIDEGTVLSPYAIVGMEPQDISYKPEDSGKLFIGKNNKIREFCTINSGTKKGDGFTSVGDECVIMAYCHIAHDCKIGNSVILANSATLAGHVEIDNFTVIGGMTPIHQFVKIGEGCMIGGASAVSQDIPPFCLAEGNRAIVKGLNLIGLKRRFSREDIRSLQSVFKMLFRSNRPIQDVVTELLAGQTDKKILQLCNFIKDTKRGIPYERK